MCVCVYRSFVAANRACGLTSQMCAKSFFSWSYWLGFRAYVYSKPSEGFGTSTWGAEGRVRECSVQ